MNIRKSSPKWIPYHINSLGYDSYKQYLQSEHWSNIKNRFYNSKLFNGGCDCCGESNCRLNLHHKTYKRLGREKLDDLIAVCDRCHKEIHYLLNNNNSSKINIWSVSKKIKNRHKKERLFSKFHGNT